MISSLSKPLRVELCEVYMLQQPKDQLFSARFQMMLMLKLYWPMASDNDSNTFRGLICIVDVGNIHKGMCRIIVFPRFIWAYKVDAIISSVAMHFEPCHGLIRPYIFLFNLLMLSSATSYSRDIEYEVNMNN